MVRVRGRDPAVWQLPAPGDRVMHVSPDAPGDPVAERRIVDLADRDAPDHVVGLVRIAGGRDPGPAVALDELNRRQEGAALVAIGRGGS